MQMAGEMRLETDPERAFDALLDPGVLERSIPGCKAFERLGDGQWRLAAELGVAGVGGRYQGTLAVLDASRPRAMRLEMELTGGPGSVSAAISVRRASSATG